MDLYFRGEKMAKVMGNLAMEKPEEGKWFVLSIVKLSVIEYL